jgi:branched-chain amino acid transport system permease protein
VSLSLQVLLSGLAAGGIYGLLAVGHTLVYRLTGIVHFAFGDLVGLAMFVSLFVVAGRSSLFAPHVSGGRFVLALAVGVAVCALASAVTYFAAIAPHAAAGSTIGWAAASLAVAFAIHAALQALFSRPSYVFPDPIPFDRIAHGGFLHVGGASLEVRSLFVLGVALVLAGATAAVLRGTRFGRGLEAIAADVEGAGIVGVPVERFVGAAFALVGAVAAVAAVVAAPSGPFGPATAAVYGVKGFVAAVAVRFRSPWDAFGAGIALGVVEASISGLDVAGHELGPEYRDVLPLAVVLLLLGLRRRPFAAVFER